jgi:hypothetical protein
MSAIDFEIEIRDRLDRRLRRMQQAVILAEEAEHVTWLHGRRLHVRLPWDRRLIIGPRAAGGEEPDGFEQMPAQMVHVSKKPPARKNRGLYSHRSGRAISPSST